MLDPKAFKPRNLAVAGRELAVAWADGHESFFPFDRLRQRCPCAACRARSDRDAAAGPLRVVRAPAAGEIAIVRLVPVGAYAVQIVWSDGHDTGIYAFDQLRLDCLCSECAGSRP